MAPRLGIFLLWAGVSVFLQLDPVNGDQHLPGRFLTPAITSDDKCVFPFIYKGNLYFDCTLHDSTYYWCSVTTYYMNRWRYCRSTDYARCALPFIFRGKEYDSCIKEGSVFSKYWCPVTPNYDRDRAWRYC
ncbi:seminal plasma protein pB1 [Phacochoerus africanus]|uniref:seminal plasma protein pB1 n=1 Tax=Phacochoerus africanus TaxID=41426 RepID=UPI001FD9D79F|nr:seminal plasma protein pB1 [Phacochoerus africanus]